MAGAGDKLLLKLAGMPVVVHSWRRFDECGLISHIVLVARPENRSVFEELARQFRLTKPFTLVEGGAQRQDSVWNGLQAVPPQTTLVVIHDAARPCLTASLLHRTVQAAFETGAAIAARPIVDTVKESNDGVTIARTLDRTRLWAAQTPQAFQIEVIRRAHAEVRARGLCVTDDAAACELIGHPVRLVPSESPNPKLTTPEDLPYIQAVLSQLQSGATSPQL